MIYHLQKVKKIPQKLKCLLVDSWYDSYLGVVILVRVIDGKIKKYENKNDVK